MITEAQTRDRNQAVGFQQIGELTKDENGIWRAKRGWAIDLPRSGSTIWAISPLSDWAVVCANDARDAPRLVD